MSDFSEISETKTKKHNVIVLIELLLIVVLLVGIMYVYLRVKTSQEVPAVADLPVEEPKKEQPILTLEEKHRLLDALRENNTSKIPSETEKEETLRNLQTEEDVSKPVMTEEEKLNVLQALKYNEG